MEHKKEIILFWREILIEFTTFILTLSSFDLSL